MKEQFKKEFVEHLKTLIPEKVKNLGLIYPEIQVGYCRFNEFGLDSVYLECLKDEHDNNVILKFKFMNFHYIPTSYKFGGIYYCPDGCNEYRFNSDLELDNVYLKDVAILPKIDIKEKLRYFNLLCKWKEIDKSLFDDREFITVWQTQKDRKPVEIGYLATHSKLKSNRNYQIMYDIIDNPNLDPDLWFCKAIIKDDTIEKDLKNIYLIVGENHVDMPMAEFWQFLQHKHKTNTKDDR
tara:strand:- start:137 stop:850 length:714 start_codon:yes stop_codon:yes gene_type:complete